MRRREFTTGLLCLGGAAVGPRKANTQQSEIPVIGFLGTETPELFVSRLDGFRAGLRETGFVEGVNVNIGYRWAAGQYERLDALAEDLVRSQVAVIHTGANGRAAVAAKRATSKIPIVFVMGADPVEAGIVSSLSRPNGNLTGITSLNVELAAKRLQVLHELTPSSGPIAFLVNPANELGANQQVTVVQDAARSLGRPLVVLQAAAEQQIDVAFSDAIQQKAAAVLVGADTLFTARIAKIAALSIHHKLPTVYHSREFAVAGGILSYGGGFADFHRLAGLYVGRILRGATIETLPVLQPTKVEMIVNLKTARLLGVTVPISLLGRADEVIE